MIKNYDFPVIFRNVVGEVVPFNILERYSALNHTNADLDLLNVETISQGTSSIGNSLGKLASANILGVQSKRKILQRRVKMVKTSSCQEYDKRTIQSDRKQQNQNCPIFVNFLKKKHEQLDKFNGNSHRQRKSNLIRYFGQQIYPEPLQLRDSNSSQRKLYKIRTSLASDKIKQKKSFKSILDKYQNIDQINYPSDETNINSSNSKGQSFESNKFSRRINGNKSKKTTKFLSQEYEQDDKVEDINNLNDDSKMGWGKKRTVNFTFEGENLEEEQLKYKQINRRNTKLGTCFNQNSTKFLKNNQYLQENGQHIFPARFQQTESSWTARSMVSIKFSSHKSIKSKKSLPSEGSFLFNDLISSSKQLHTKSQRYRTNTGKRLQSTFKFSYRKFTSLEKLSQTSIQKYAHQQKKQSKFQVSKAKINTKKQIKNGTNKMIKKVKVNCKKSILAKKSDPFLQLVSGKNVELSVFPSTNTFRDLGHCKNIKNVCKTLNNDNRGDVFQQLNNFNKFMNDNNIQEPDESYRNNFAQPIVISNETQHKYCTNPLNFMKDNMMIDMGLTLVKKMNQLVQKKP